MRLRDLEKLSKKLNNCIHAKLCCDLATLSSSVIVNIPSQNQKGETSLTKPLRETYHLVRNELSPNQFGLVIGSGADRVSHLSGS